MIKDYLVNLDWKIKTIQKKYEVVTFTHSLFLGQLRGIRGHL
jgi:hypothetical protein